MGKYGNLHCQGTLSVQLCFNLFETDTLLFQVVMLTADIVIWYNVIMYCLGQEGTLRQLLNCPEYQDQLLQSSHRNIHNITEHDGKCWCVFVHTMDQVHQCDTAIVMSLITAGEVGIICSDEQFNVTQVVRYIQLRSDQGT